MPRAVNLWLFGVILVCLILSLFAIVLRIIGRRRRQSLQADDWTMVLTELLFIPCAVCALISVSKGLGIRDDRLLPSQIIAATMYFTIFDFFYCMTLGPLRSSLCLTLLRFAAGKRMRQLIYVMIALHIATTIVSFAILMAICRPYSAIWRHFYDFPDYPKEGTCFSGTNIKTLVYLLTAITSISDLLGVIIPTIIFWNSRMDRQKKIMAWLLLSLGLLATIATLARLPFNSYWTARRDRIWGLGMGTLCCCLEIFFGIVAGCAPAIKPFFVTAVHKLRPRVNHGEDASLPTATSARVSNRKGLTDFSYNTTDLKAIHSPRGDVLEITGTVFQESSSWGSKSTPTNTFELSRLTS
ncbi:hypothetical protein E4T50_04806 [Aureobasidium sp. EXF-12298]|nr:hypothetical protein E4T50_04806 [Aureobasidium sp. EXF-12298]